MLNDRRLERLLLRDERCECKILLGIKYEDTCTCRIGLFVFFVLGHGVIGDLDFDDQLVAMLLEMEHGEVDYVDFVGALQQKLVTGRRGIISLATNLDKSAP